MLRRSCRPGSGRRCVGGASGSDGAAAGASGAASGAASTGACVSGAASSVGASSVGASSVGASAGVAASGVGASGAASGAASAVGGVGCGCGLGLRRGLGRGGGVRRGRGRRGPVGLGVAAAEPGARPGVGALALGPLGRRPRAPPPPCRPGGDPAGTWAPPAPRPRAWATRGTFTPAAATTALSSSEGSAGRDSGATRAWTGERERASSTVAHRSVGVSAVSEAAAASVRRVASSAGRSDPAFGGRELTRRARTTRPSPSREAISASQAAWSASMRRSRPSLSWVARARLSSSRAAESAATTTVRRSRRSSSSMSARAASARSRHSAVRSLGSRRSARASSWAGLDLGSALGAGLGVLLLDRLADRGDPAPQHLLGDGPLVDLEGVEHGLAVGPAGPEPLGLGRVVGSGPPGPVGRARGPGRPSGRPGRHGHLGRSRSPGAATSGRAPRPSPRSPGPPLAAPAVAAAAGAAVAPAALAGARLGRRRRGPGRGGPSCRPAWRSPARRRRGRGWPAPGGRASGWTPWAGSTEVTSLPSRPVSTSARSTSPTEVASGSRPPSSTPLGCLAPAALQVQVPSSRVLVSSISIRRDISRPPYSRPPHDLTVRSASASDRGLAEGCPSSPLRSVTWCLSRGARSIMDGGRPGGPVSSTGSR